MTSDHGAKERKIAGQTVIVAGPSFGISARIPRELGDAETNVVMNYVGNRTGRHHLQNF